MEKNIVWHNEQAHISRRLQIILVISRIQTQFTNVDVVLNIYFSFTKFFNLFKNNDKSS